MKKKSLIEVIKSRFSSQTWRPSFAEEKPKYTEIVLPPSLSCLKSLIKYNSLQYICFLSVHKIAVNHSKSLSK